MCDHMEAVAGSSERPLNSAERWKRTLEKIVDSVVVLKCTQTRAFDTESAGSSYATGFVVDKERGLILTNRHVVTPSPIVAEAVFQNREEVPVLPLYYDPIHDFGFFRFDPKRLKFMQVQEVPLDAEAAAVGMDIRVVGNDSGEKISILSGTLARLDRDAPHYGRKHYNDFNTFYIQAASGTKGGSSGSPVVDIRGRAVALNAGGKNKAASAYYLPLQRVVRALNILRTCLMADGVTWRAPVIPRGDFQATFVFKGFDEVKRLGLQEETEAQVRAAQASGRAHSQREETISNSTATSENIGIGGSQSTGMLVVESIVPGGPADGYLEPGDVLVRLNGAFVSEFLAMEDLLDSRVGRTVTVEVERGGTPVRVELLVQNLHAVTPARLLELGGGSVHEMSYQQARNNRSPVGQVYIAEPGYLLGRSGCHKGAIITALNGKSTSNLAEFTSALLELAQGQRVPLEYFTFDERSRRKQTIFNVDWCFYSAPVQWDRDNAAGVWKATTLWPESLKHAADGGGGGGGGGGAKVPLQLASPRLHSVQDVAASSDIEKTQAGVTAQNDDQRLMRVSFGDLPDGVSGDEAWRTRLEERLRSSLVQIDVEIPLVCLADGVHSRAFAGSGIIVHLSTKIGLVLTDRNTAIGCADIMLSLGAFPAEISAKVRFLHPLHNFALLSFDPSELSADAARLISAVELKTSPPLRRGDMVELISLSKSMRILHRTSMVTNPTMAVHISHADVPRFRAVHEEVIKVDQDFGISYSGVLTDRSGAVRALWGSYSEQVDKEEREWTAGMPTSVFQPWIKELIARLDPSPHPAEIPALDVPSALPPSVRVLDAELEPLLLSKAAQFGLPGEWVSRLMQLDPERRQVLRVQSTVAASHAQQVLKDGDMVLAVAGQPVSSFWDVEKIIQGYGNSVEEVPQQHSDGQANGGGDVEERRNGGIASHAVPAVALTILRGGAVFDVEVRLGLEDGLGTSRLVHWCGAQLQAPHRSVRELGFLPEQASGVYISRWHHGSPAHRFGLYALYWIVEVNGVVTPDLDAFLAVVSSLGDGADVRLKVVHYETAKPKVLTLKTDLRYWPTWELRLDAARGEWSRRELASPL